MKKIGLKLLISVLTLMLLSCSLVLAKKTPDQERAELDKMSGEVLTRMYKTYPTSSKAVELTYGYVTLSGAGVNYGIFGSEHARGVAVNNKTGERIYVEMQNLSLGISIGAKEFDILFVAVTPEAFKNLVFGKIDLGAEVTAGATDGVSGGAYAGSTTLTKGIYMYQVDKKGLAVNLNLKGTKISPYKHLNPSLYPNGKK